MLPVILSNYNAGDALGFGMCGLFGLVYFMVWMSAIGLGIFLFVFKILMIIDVARKRYSSGSNEQVVWILVILLVPIGSIIYFLVVKMPDDESPGLKPRPAP